jgi:glycosyltransferase involved in cell wall biosynthesis
MTKKKVGFYLKKFLNGGIESTLVQYLKHIDTDIYEVYLVIGFETFPRSTLLVQIPANVKILHIVSRGFLFSLPLLSHTDSSNMVQKLLYQAITRPISKLYLFHKSISLLKNFDCVVDYGLTLGSRVKKLNGVKIGYFHFRLSHHYQPNNVTRRFHRVLPNYDHLVVINKQMLQDAEAIFPECHGKFVLIYNQFNFIDIHELSLQSHAESKLLDQEFILSSGRLIESQKDFTSLIKAYSCLKNKFHRNEKLYIIGDGPDRSNLQTLIQELGLSDDVFLLGFQKNPFIWIKRAQCFVLSSKHEGLPSVLIEAMILNIPVVATDCPDGPNEILLDGRAGALVEVSNVEAISVAINRVLSDINYANNLKLVAKQNLNRFNIKDNIHRLYKIFNS